MLVVGLTGGIGSGKTAVSDRFAALGVPIIDADQISRTLVEPGSPILEQIANTFGREYINASGQLDRSRLRSHIFADDQARLTLESILHPAIRMQMKRRLSELNAPYAILVIPLLAETGQTGMLDRVLLVDIPESVQTQRVMQRDNISLLAAREILDSQASRQQRLALADDVINNEKPAAELDRTVDNLHKKYLQLSSQT